MEDIATEFVSQPHTFKQTAAKWTQSFANQDLKLKRPAPVSSSDLPGGIRDDNSENVPMESNSDPDEDEDVFASSKRFKFTKS